MIDPSPAFQIPLWADLLAVGVGSLQGALFAAGFRDRRLDLLGVAIIGIATGFGGGILRDVLLGATPPDSLVDGRYLAIAGGGVVQLWDVGDHADLRRLSENTVGEGPTSLAFSPDGTALAVATGNIVGLWDIVADPSEPRTITKMADPSADVRTVAFAPSGNILAAGGYRTVILWDVTDRANPQRVSALTGHADGISRIAFNADGTTMAVGDRARWATLWDIAQLARPIRLSRIDSFDALRDGALTFSPDATTLAIGDDDGAGDVVLWDLARLNRLRADPAAFGCVMAVKGLTPAEWRRLIPELDYQPTCNG